MSTTNRDKASQEELREKIHQRAEETKQKLRDLSQKMNGILGKLSEMPENYGIPVDRRSDSSRDSQKREDRSDPFQ
ncbi:hypothetical protein [Gorillibacterium sp. CAU 1737]|uniref:hypothetical protein n=1 Tax=Gorillibacterium sp. CAU 1737 TaxID=3140362 RepID=UPI00326105BC